MCSTVQFNYRHPKHYLHLLSVTVLSEYTQTQLPSSSAQLADWARRACVRLVCSAAGPTKWLAHMSLMRRTSYRRSPASAAAGLRCWLTNTAPVALTIVFVFFRYSTVCMHVNSQYVRWYYIGVRTYKALLIITTPPIYNLYSTRNAVCYTLQETC
jgi:hypothetical protein